MNKQRRKSLDTLYTRIESLKADLEDILSEEQEAYDNLPESLQDSERGETMYDAIDNLESAVADLEEAMDYIIEAIG